jgi:hypothetical protein
MPSNILSDNAHAAHSNQLDKCSEWWFIFHHCRYRINMVHNKESHEIVDNKHE